MTFDEYQVKAFSTARFDRGETGWLDIPILGVIGELGSIASEIKKSIRDGRAYTDSEQHLGEEFGDLLWYLAAIASEHEISLSSLQVSSAESYEKTNRPVWLYKLSDAIAILIPAAICVDAGTVEKNNAKLSNALSFALEALIAAISAEGLVLDDILASNLNKGKDKFGKSDENVPAKCFDRAFPSYEQLPRTLRMQVFERPQTSARQEVILLVNDLVIGDRLTDNSSTNDGYRFHDVFHFAYAAVLGWSPVTRSIFRCKRKSDPGIDEVQDGARAAIVEEAIAHTVFQYAEGHSLLKDLKHIDHGILKLIKRMVRGLEVESAAMHEWEDAIFTGFKAFRELKDNRGGWLMLNAETRSLVYQKNGPVVG